MEYQRVLLKLNAKRAMKQTNANPMLTTLLVLVMTVVVSWLIKFLLGMVSGMTEITTWFLTETNNGADVEYLLEYLVRALGWGRIFVALLVGGLLSSLLSYIWQSVINAGYCGYCLSIVRGQETSMNSAFSGFSRMGSVLSAKLLAYVFVFLWTLLFTAGLMAVVVLTIGMLIRVSEALCVLLLMGECVAYTVGVVWVGLRYAMVDFAVMDQGLSGLNAIRESKRLMRGNAGKLFCLRLSFIGWYFAALGIFYAVMLVVMIFVGMSAGPFGIVGTGGTVAIVVAVILYLIGLFIMILWLKPYMTGSEALFYDWARGAGPAGPAYGGPAAGPGSGWGASGSQSQNYNYSWSAGPGGSGSGIGSGPQPGGSGSQPAAPQSGTGWNEGPGAAEPRRGTSWSGESGDSAPKPPRDDPWA